MPSAALVTSLHGEELALSSSFVFDGALLKQRALLAGLVCTLLLFAPLPLPCLFPPPPPRPFVFTAWASILWSGWLGLLFAEGKCQTVLWSFFCFFPSSGTVFRLEQEKRGALASSSIHTHSAVMGESLLAGLGMAGTTSAFGPQPERGDVKVGWQVLV